MSTSYQSISDATTNALVELYGQNERIRIRDGRINGEEVPKDAYAAIVERVKTNADLLGDNFQPGANSQILLKFGEVKRDFDVTVGEGMSIQLDLRE